MTYCKTVWLIDDDELCNFLTAHTLQTTSFCSEIRSFTKAQEALIELEASIEKGTFPDIIFLDLNMPLVDGWAFLHAYHKFRKEVKDNCTIYILSSSINVDDILKCKLHEDVRDFFSKPLNKLNLEIIKFQTKDR